MIRSQRSLTYAQAQAIIDDTADQSELALSIRRLNQVARKLKAQRLEVGALQLASTQVKFDMDQQTHTPNDVRLYDLLQTNSLVEEFMLLANCATATKITQSFPSISLLRRHGQPQSRNLDQLRRVLETRGFQLKYSTSRQLADCLDRVKTDDPFFNKLVRILVTRCMCEAQYFCTADFDPSQFVHYGLACPLYTHFTSPIRRYADVIVHRLLAAALDLQPLPSAISNKLRLTKLADLMNFRHRMARFASKASSDYHTYLYFRGRHVVESAFITALKPASVCLLLPTYGLQTQLSLSAQEATASAPLLTSQQVYIGGKARRLFDRVTVSVQVKLQGIHKKVVLTVIS